MDSIVQVNLMKHKPYPKYKPSGIEWLGDVPEHWEVRKLKTVTRFGYGDSLAADDRIDGEFFVYGSNGVVGEHDQANTKAPCLIVGRKGSFGKVAYSDKPCFAIDTTYFIDSRLSNNNLKWLYYCLLWLRLDSFSKDSAVPGLARDDAYYKPVAVCSFEEQEAIAAYLDGVTSRVDKLIAAKRRQIELLKEKRSALITHAVTKGLNPNAKLKPSGIDWLGDVPEHWEVKCVKYITQILRGKFTHRPRNDPRMYDGPYPFVQTGDVASAHKMIRQHHQTLSEDGFAVSKMFPKGTLVMTIAANIGDMAILDFEACFPDSIVGFVPEDDVCLNFLYYLFIGLHPSLMNTATLNTQLNLNVDRIGVLFAVKPSRSEQETIAAYLDEQTSRIDSIIAKVEESIEKLKEYRTAIISAAVTGKIDVREVV